MAIDAAQCGVEFGKDPGDSLRVVLAGDFGQHGFLDLDDFAPRARHSAFQFGKQRMRRPAARHDECFGQDAGQARIGEQAQAFSQETLFAPAMLLVAQRAQELYKWIGKSGDDAPL